MVSGFFSRGQLNVVLVALLIIPVIAFVYFMNSSLVPAMQDFLSDYFADNEDNIEDVGIHKLIFSLYPFAFLIIGIVILFVALKGQGSQF